MSLPSLSVHDFIQALASPEPTPGGGTAAAVAGAMGAGLLAMVAGLTRTRGNTDDERATLRGVRERIVPILEALERCADRDAAAFDGVMAAYRRPKATDEEKAVRKAGIDAAMRGATEVPLETLRLVVEALELGVTVAALGNRSAVSDVSVGAGLLEAAANGATANVRINLEGLGDEEYRRDTAESVAGMVSRAGTSLGKIRAALS
jgi:glutamate formiminotransferase/formiminotetrahydrofolate cyclodeaminase